MEYPKNDRTVKNTPPPLDWNAIRERALFHARHASNAEAMVKGIGPGETGERALIGFARDTDASLDWLVKGERPHFKALTRADVTISDLRAFVWAVDRLTYDPSPSVEERANDDHSVRILILHAWRLIEAHDKAEQGDVKVAA